MCDGCDCDVNFSFIENTPWIHLAVMVVAHVASSQPTAPISARRKNRRKTSRKNAQTDPSQNDIQGDGEMDENDMGSSTLQPTAAASSSTPPIADDDELMIDADPSFLAPSTSAPMFPPVSPNAEKTTLKSETRRIPIPPHRMTPLKKDWVNIFGPLTEILGLQVRMNVQRRCVEARVRIIVVQSKNLVIDRFVSPDFEAYERHRGSSKGC
jgi:RNA-binding protein PNO1